MSGTQWDRQQSSDRNTLLQFIVCACRVEAQLSGGQVVLHTELHDRLTAARKQFNELSNKRLKAAICALLEVK